MKKFELYCSFKTNYILKQRVCQQFRVNGGHNTTRKHFSTPLEKGHISTGSCHDPILVALSRDMATSSLWAATTAGIFGLD